MNYYYLVFVVLCIGVILWHGVRKTAKQNLYILTCVLLLLFTICRSPFDTNWPDTYNYVTRFFHISNNVAWENIFATGWEPGTVVIAKIVGMFVNTEQVYIVVFGLIILIPFFIMIWKYSESPMLSIFSFYAMGNLMATSIVRQWCAISILLYFIPLIKERKFIKFLLVIFVAFLFHRTAIVFIVAYFIYNVPVSKRYICGAAGISIALYFLGPQLLSFMNQFARIKYAVEYNGGETLLIALWICIIAAYIFCKRLYDNQEFRLCFNMILVAAMIHPISFTFSIWSRVVLYFSVFLILLIPKAIVCVEQGSAYNRRLSIPVELVYMAVMLSWFAGGKYVQYIPFK